MKDMLDDIPDDSLRKKLQHYSENPDEDLWEKIESGMQQPVPVKNILKHYVEEPDGSVWTGVQRRMVLHNTFRRFEIGSSLISVAALLLLVYLFLPREINSGTTEDGVNAPKLNDSVLLPKVDDDKRKVGPLAMPAIREVDRPSYVQKLSSVAELQNYASHTAEGKRNNVSTDEDQRRSDFAIPILPVDEDKHEDAILSANAALTGSSNIDSLNSVICETDHTQQSSADADTTDKILTDTSQIIVVKLDTIRKIDLPLDVETTEKKSKDKKPAGFYFLFMPTLGYQHVSPVTDDNILIESIERVSAFSLKRLGIRLEAGFEKYLTRRVAFNVGILYYQRKQTINYQYRDTSQPEVSQLNPNAFTYSVSLQQQSATFEYDLKNVGVLGGLNYTITGKRFIQKFGLDAELQKGLRAPTSEVDTHQQFYVFGDVFYRIAFPINKRFDMMFQPTINYALQLDERINAPFYVKPYGLGLNFGVYYHF
jgi:hypothetical protein